MLTAYERGVKNAHILAGATLIGFLQEEQNTATKLNQWRFLPYIKKRTLTQDTGVFRCYKKRCLKRIARG